MKSFFLYKFSIAILVVLTIIQFRCNDDVTPSAYLFRVYETTLRSAKGLDAIPFDGGYMIMAEATNDNAPLFIRTNTEGTVDTSWRFQMWLPYATYPNPTQLLGPFNDTLFRFCGYTHRDSSLTNQYSEIFSFSLNSWMDTCIDYNLDKCLKWRVGQSPATNPALPPILAIEQVSDGGFLAMERPAGTDAIRFVYFDAFGKIQREVTLDSVPHAPGQRWYFPEGRLHEYYILEENIGKDVFYVALFEESATGAITQATYSLPTSMQPDSNGNILQIVGLRGVSHINDRIFALFVNGGYAEVSTQAGQYVQFTGVESVYKLLDLNIEKPIKASASIDEKYIYIVGSDYAGGVIVYKFDRQKFAEANPSTPPTYEFRKEYGAGSQLEPTSVRALENGDLLICGSSYFSGINPRPFLMRVSGNNGDL